MQEVPHTPPPADPAGDTPPDLPPADARRAAACDALQALAIAFTLHAHAPVFTVEEARALRGAIPGVHTKNLFLKDRTGALVLVIAAEDTDIDLKALPAAMGLKRFSFGSPALLGEMLGVPPGAVTGLALINDRAVRVQPVIDARLLNAPRVACHPLTNDATVTLGPHDFLRVLASRGHRLRVADFTAAPPVLRPLD